MSIDKHYYIGPIIICDYNAEKIAQDYYGGWAGWQDYIHEVLKDTLVTFCSCVGDKSIPNDKIGLLPNKLKSEDFFLRDAQENQLHNDMVDLLKINFNEEIEKFKAIYKKEIDELRNAGANPTITYVSAEYDI